MSSDEDDMDDSGNRLLTIRSKNWLNPLVPIFLRDLDAIDLALRVTTAGRVKRGNWPLPRRVLPGKASDRGPVSGLPNPFYSSTWLASLTKFERDSLDIIEKEYDFSHSPRILS
jgi:hypothetical protein